MVGVTYNTMATRRWSLVAVSARCPRYELSHQVVALTNSQHFVILQNLNRVELSTTGVATSL